MAVYTTLSDIHTLTLCIPRSPRTMFVLALDFTNNVQLSTLNEGVGRGGGVMLKLGVILKLDIIALSGKTGQAYLRTRWLQYIISSGLKFGCLL